MNYWVAQRGSRKVHPNDHVNFGQSSNDVIPTAIHLSALVSIDKNLMPALLELQQALSDKATEFMPIIKTGRTHLQDATPIRLGQEFQGYTGQIERAIIRLGYAQQELSEVALGGTAVGTGVNTHPEFAARVCERLTLLNGVTVRETSNHFQAQSTLDNIVAASGILNTISVSLIKIANDIRWLGSGPRAGIGEIELTICTARKLDHAWQGQSGDCRIGRDGLCASYGQPHHDYCRRASRQL